MLRIWFEFNGRGHEITPKKRGGGIWEFNLKNGEHNCKKVLIF